MDEHLRLRHQCLGERSLRVVTSREHLAEGKIMQVLKINPIRVPCSNEALRQSKVEGKRCDSHEPSEWREVLDLAWPRALPSSKHELANGADDEQFVQQ